jgi:hypothetical protein
MAELMGDCLRHRRHSAEPEPVYAVSALAGECQLSREGGR